MKVLMINSHFTSGGPPRVMNGIYDVLVANGHECKIAAARGDFYVKKDSIKIGGNIYMNALKSRLLDNEGFNAAKATEKLIEDIKQYNPDIIHLHNLHGYYLNVEILFEFLKKFNKPVVWTLHDMWPFSGHSAVCDYSSCEKWKTVCSKCPCLKEYPLAVYDFSKRNFRKKKEIFCGVDNLTIVTPSNWLAGLVRQSFLGDYPVQVIHNGIDLSKFHPTGNAFRKKRGLIDKTVVLGVAAVWNARKGFYDFIELSKRLGDSTTLVMVGLNQQQVKHLPDNIVGICKTENLEELVDIYSSADVFVNFTYADVLGMVNIEALASGTPVITYDTGGSPEAINETSGFVTKKGDYKRVADIILNEDFKTISAEACIDRANMFDMHSKYSEYIKLYMRVANAIV